MGQSSKHYNLLGERKDNKHISSGNRQETSNGKKPSKVNHLYYRGVYNTSIYKLHNKKNHAGKIVFT